MYLCCSRYLHACTSLPLAEGQLGVMVAGGYSHDYLNTTELYKPTENRWGKRENKSDCLSSADLVLVMRNNFGRFRNLSCL
jgi:hypothetical protein